MENGLGNIYNPTQLEMNSIVDSYNNLGGIKGTGLDFNTWKSSMGIGDVDKNILGKTTDFLGSDTMKGLGTIGSLGLGVFNIMNTRDAQKQAKQMWEAENARANELMAMNKEKYETYKADKAKLNSQYV